MTDEILTTNRPIGTDEMLKTDRTIRALHWPGENKTLTVGGMVKSIRCYAEPGPRGDLPWFVVEFTDGCQTRYNAQMVESVGYQPEPEA